MNMNLVFLLGWMSIAVLSCRFGESRSLTRLSATGGNNTLSEGLWQHGGGTRAERCRRNFLK
ncbi:hypothetical protein, partial [Candidatus Electronema sp. JM]|uniref:hypothetical protein n=1 Tax=Candidatus Electronema sp. JM TaxID=3401571 RepID=UPI003AA99846